MIHAESEVFVTMCEIKPGTLMAPGDAILDEYAVISNPFSVTCKACRRKLMQIPAFATHVREVAKGACRVIESFGDEDEDDPPDNVVPIHGGRCFR